LVSACEGCVCAYAREEGGGLNTGLSQQTFLSCRKLQEGEEEYSNDVV
jgi:hypothetical protein